MTLPDLPLTGGCQCGQLRYRLTSAPTTLYCCHCSECQKQSASAFGMSLRIEDDGVEIEGRMASRVRDAGTERAVECVFCPDCGTRIVHRGRGGDGGSSLKAGTLDARDWLVPVGHIWTRSAQHWVAMDGLCYKKQPDDDYAALKAAFAERHA